MSSLQKRSTIALETSLLVIARNLELQLYELNKLRHQVRQAELSARKSRSRDNGTYKRTLGQGPKPGCSTEPAAIAAHQRERFAGDGEIFGRGGRLKRKIFRNLDGQAIANTPECSKGHCVARGLTADEGIVFKEHFRPPSIQEVLHWSHAKSNRNAPPADLEQPDFLSVMSARTSAELAARSLDRK